MDVSAHIDSLRADGELLATAATLSGPSAPVPTCPDWAVRDLLLHQGAVHRWATAYVAGEHTEAGAVDFVAARGPKPEDADLVFWFVSGHGKLVATLETASPDVPCWSFLPSPSPLAFWARRQAHETSIHRVDAELAAGRPNSTIDPIFAADGIDELLVGFAPLRGAPAEGGTAPTSIVFRCTDVDAGWVLRTGPAGVRATALSAADGLGEEDVSCTIRGGAADLYLTLWRRAKPGALTLEGEPRALDLLLEQVRI